MRLPIPQKKIDAFFTYARDIGFNLIEISNGVISLSADQKGGSNKCRPEKGFFGNLRGRQKRAAGGSEAHRAGAYCEAQSDLRAGA